MRGWWRGHGTVVVWSAVFLALAGVIVVAATGTSGPALDFQRSGHWVYNMAQSAMFHVSGATKQVDVRTSNVDGGAGPHPVFQGGTSVYMVSSSKVLVFGKSTLTAESTIPVEINEEPVGFEVAGGPYLVYRQAGTIVRLGQSAVTMHAGGALGEPVVTPAGSLWVQRKDTGKLCELGRDSVHLECSVDVPSGSQGVLTVVGEQAAFVDTMAAVVHRVGHGGLGPAVGLGVTAPADAKTASADVAGRLPVLDPRGNELLLADVSGVGEGRSGASAIKVALGPGNYGAPAAATNAVVILDYAGGRVLTFDGHGARRSEVKLPEGAGAPRLSRGEDGRVYIDSQSGDHTLVVDANGAVTDVKIVKPLPTSSAPVPSKPTETESPATGPPPPPPPPPSVPPPALPGAPLSVYARAGDATVAVSWGAAPANGAAITAYQVSWRVVSGSAAGGSVTVPGNHLAAEVGGLRNGATYVFTVRAQNSVGQGPGADSPPVIPSAGAPSAPTAVSATAASDGSVTVTWQAADGQGHRVASYDVTAAGSDGSTNKVASSPATQVVIAAGKQLVLGVTYQFTVTAASDTGVISPASSPSPAVTPYRPADAPTGFTAAGGDGTVTLSWSAPRLNGGDLVSYRVSASGLADQTVTATSTSYTGLANGTTYTFQVRAVTREHNKSNGPTVEGAVATATATPGTTPTVDVGSASLTGDRQVTVHLDVLDHGSGSVTCHVFFSGAERWTGACSGAMDIPVGGLSYSTTYDVYATGSNSFGTGAPGRHASVRTNDPPPSPSISVTLGASTVQPNCQAPCNWVQVHMQNFAPNTQYTVECWADYPPPTSSFWSKTIRTDGAGNADDPTVCYFGYRGHQVWAKANGIESNKLTY